jgi:hypothetical protein
MVVMTAVMMVELMAVWTVVLKVELLVELMALN